LRALPWGAGTVWLPGDTTANTAAGQIDLLGGWVWGQTPDAAPLVIGAQGTEIRLAGGRFALEVLPGQPAWLYVFEGQAQAVTAAGEAVTVTAGQMLTWQAAQSERLVAVPQDPLVVAALHAGTASPLRAEWEPSLAARVRDRLALLGIGAAQLVTFVTYLIVIVALFVVPASGVIWWLHKLRKPGE
jgi:hypothetical protein